MVVDGAVTTKATSDLTGIAVAGLSVAEKKLFVREAVGVKLSGEALRRRVIEVGVANDVDYLLVEANQGGDLWHVVFHDMPFKVSTFMQKEPKQYRIRRFLALYQRSGGAVFHEKPLPQLEAQQSAYPNLVHEDVLDASAAVAEHLVAMLFQQIGTRDKTAVHQFSYR
jgi:phage terminase large subunit-like protein